VIHHFSICDVKIVQALQPFLEGLLRRGLDKFASFAKTYEADLTS
jgi:hypothetical protein